MESKGERRVTRVEEMREPEQAAGVASRWHLTTCRTGLAFVFAAESALRACEIGATRLCCTLNPVIPGLAHATALLLRVVI